MKTRYLLSLLAGVALTTGCAIAAVAAPKSTDNVTVTFLDPDKFTDVLENGSSLTSTYYLEELRDCLQKAAAPLLAEGQKLAVTVTDVDLAGETRFNQPQQIRIMKDIYMPRAELKFQLLGADGKVVAEGTRRLIDRNFMLQVRIPGSEEPLYYDKQMLKQWVRAEFKTKG
jgi:hypothetical protein